MKHLLHASAAMLTAALVACGATGPDVPAASPSSAPASTAPAARQKDPPPESGPARPVAFPAVDWAELPNGVKVATIVGKALPLVHLRVVVFGGRAVDGEKPGLAELTARSLLDGGAGPYASRELATRIESLGGESHVEVDADRTVLRLAVTKNNLGEAMDLLAAMVQGPRFEAGEFAKTRRRAVDEVADAARSNGEFGARMMLYQEIFALPADRHPYATYGATAFDLAKITLADCRVHHKRWFVPKNTLVVVAGDTSPAEVKVAASHAFVTFRGGDPPTVSFTDPMPAEHRKVVLVDRPNASQSDVYVGALGPARADKTFAAFDVANQVLGGGMSGRMFREIRERQSLAYRARSTITEFAHGPSLLVAHVGTQTPKTGQAVEAVLAQIEQLDKTTPSAEEVSVATRFLSDVFAIRMETVGAAADELVRLRTLGLPDDYDDGYKKAIRDIEPAYAGKVAGEYVRAGHEIVVVAGDANVVGPVLAHFGEVRVVDPTKGFARVRTLPFDASPMPATPAASK